MLTRAVFVAVAVVVAAVVAAVVGDGAAVVAAVVAVAVIAVVAVVVDVVAVAVVAVVAAVVHKSYKYHLMQHCTNIFVQAFALVENQSISLLNRHSIDNNQNNCSRRKNNNV